MTDITELERYQRRTAILFAENDLKNTEQGISLWEVHNKVAEKTPE